MQFFAFSKGLSLLIGSVETTSTAAPPTFPSFKAFARSASQIRPPRPLLTINTPSFIFAIFCALISSLVSSFKMQCNTIASDFAKSSSLVTKSTKPFHSSLGCGVYTTTFIPSALAVFAVWEPMAPRPIIPKVLSANSIVGFFQ